MANFWYPHALDQMSRGSLDLSQAATKIHVVLFETGSTCLDNDANRDVTSISGFTVFDEHPTAGRPLLTNISLAKDAANNRTELTADPTVFSALADSGEQVIGLFLEWRVTDDTDSYPIAGFDTGGFPFTPTGSDNTVTWDSEGALQVTSA